MTGSGPHFEDGLYFGTYPGPPDHPLAETPEKPDWPTEDMITAWNEHNDHAPDPFDEDE